MQSPDTTVSLFRRRPSRLAQLMLYSALALVLMVCDARFALTGPLRAGIATALTPLQWLMLQPVRGVHLAAGWRDALHQARQQSRQQGQARALEARRAWLLDELEQENARLRALLQLRQRLEGPAMAAEVLHEGADLYTRRVHINRGGLHGVLPGSAVLDARGVVGQVTRVEWLRAEVTLLVDPAQSIPVFNPRSGIHGVTHGDASVQRPNLMQLHFMPANADVRVGDVLTTSGMDGLYPPGIPVARVLHVAPGQEAGFLRIECQPLAQIQTLGHVLVLAPREGRAPRTAPPPPPPTAQEPAA